MYIAVNLIVIGLALEAASEDKEPKSYGFSIYNYNASIVVSNMEHFSK
jgi:hypothetical protein